MKIGRKFNQLTKKEYFHYIDHYKKYTDFNTLGLYHSILENERLSLTDQLELRDYAHQTFSKTFEFYQLKAPVLYIELSSLGQELTKADEDQLWENLKKNQEKILKEKRIKHRNFGTYSKHNCGDEKCYLHGVMLQKGSWFSYGDMCFDSDKNEYAAKEKSFRNRKARKSKHKIIQHELDEGNE